MRPAHLAIDLHVPERDVQIELHPAPGRITALVGPNGAGKSTLLDAVAGALGPIGDVRVDDRSIGRLPAHRRGIGHLPQRAALFSHMDVRANVAFGPRAQGARGPTARRIAQEMLERVGAAQLARRRPRELSGGQAQRVALARVLAPGPAVMLLDEPFAALDAEVATQLRSLLARQLEGRTALMATHDLLDVLALADDIAVLEGGRLLGHGPRAEIIARPPTPFVAHLVGRSMVTGRLEDGAVRTADGGLIPGRVDEGLVRGQAVAALVDPAGTHLAEPHREPQEGEVRVGLESVGRLGSDVVLRGGGLAVQIDPESAARELPRVGEELRIVVPEGASRIYACTYGTR